MGARLVLQSMLLRSCPIASCVLLCAGLIIRLMIIFVCAQPLQACLGGVPDNERIGKFLYKNGADRVRALSFSPSLALAVRVFFASWVYGHSCNDALNS